MQINQYNISQLPSASGSKSSGNGDVGDTEAFSAEITPFLKEEDVFFYHNRISEWSTGAFDLFRDLTGYNVLNDGRQDHEYYFYTDAGEEPSEDVRKMLLDSAKVFETADRRKIDSSAYAFELDVDGITEAVRKIVAEFDSNAGIYEQLRESSQTGTEGTDVLDLLTNVLDGEKLTSSSEANT